MQTALFSRAIPSVRHFPFPFFFTRSLVFIPFSTPSMLRHCRLGDRKGIRPVRTLIPAIPNASSLDPQENRTARLTCTKNLNKNRPMGGGYDYVSISIRLQFD